LLVSVRSVASIMLVVDCGSQQSCCLQRGRCHTDAVTTAFAPADWRAITRAFVGIDRFAD
jgi:hypothetical protein